MQGTYNVNVQIAGLSIQGRAVREADSGQAFNPTLAASKAGQLTTRTDTNTGTITMASGGHGITTGQIVDIFWDGGLQRTVTVGTVAGTAVPFDLGIGDDLPDNLTQVIVSPRTQINCGIDGDELSLAALKAEYTDQNSTAKAHISFYDAADDEIAEIDLTANIVRTWDIDAGDANPFAGDVITYAMASNGSSTAAATLKLGYLQDSTP